MRNRNINRYVSCDYLVKFIFYYVCLYLCYYRFYVLEVKDKN